MTTLGELRNRLYIKLSKAYNTKENLKESLRTFISVLNESDDFKAAYNLYTELEGMTLTDREVAFEAINEAKDEFSKYVVSESYMKAFTTLLEMVSDVEVSKNTLTEDIDTVLYSKGTIAERSIAKKSIVNHIMSEKTIKESVKPVSQGLLTNLLTIKFNEQFSSLSESERESFSRYTTMKPNELKKAVDTLKEDISVMMEPLHEDENLRDTAVLVESKVNNSTYDVISLFKLEELKNSLS
jgi:hypothetical protein